MTDAVARALREKLAALFPHDWRNAVPWGYPYQSELALVAGVFGAQVTDKAVADVVEQYFHAKPGQMLDDLRLISDGTVQDLIAAVGPRWGDTNVLGVPVLRVQVVHDAAKVLTKHGVVTTQDLKAAATSKDLRRDILSVRGLGERTWSEIALMAHAQLPPSAATVAFVAELAAGEVEATADAVDALLKATARRFAVERRVLDHAIAEHLTSA